MASMEETVLSLLLHLSHPPPIAATPTAPTATDSHRLRGALAAFMRRSTALCVGCRRAVATDVFAIDCGGHRNRQLCFSCLNLVDAEPRCQVCDALRRVATVAASSSHPSSAAAESAAAVLSPASLPTAVDYVVARMLKRFKSQQQRQPSIAETTTTVRRADGKKPVKRAEPNGTANLSVHVVLRIVGAKGGMAAAERALAAFDAAITAQLNTFLAQSEAPPMTIAADGVATATHVEPALVTLLLSLALRVPTRRDHGFTTKAESVAAALDEPQELETRTAIRAVIQRLVSSSPSSGHHNNNTAVVVWRLHGISIPSSETLHRTWMHLVCEEISLAPELLPSIAHLELNRFVLASPDPMYRIWRSGCNLRGFTLNGISGSRTARPQLELLLKRSAALRQLSLPLDLNGVEDTQAVLQALQEALIAAASAADAARRAIAANKHVRGASGAVIPPPPPPRPLRSLKCKYVPSVAPAIPLRRLHIELGRGDESRAAALVAWTETPWLRELALSFDTQHGEDRSIDVLLALAASRRARRRLVALRFTPFPVVRPWLAATLLSFARLTVLEVPNIAATTCLVEAIKLGSATSSAPRSAAHSVVFPLLQQLSVCCAEGLDYSALFVASDATWAALNRFSCHGEALDDRQWCAFVARHPLLTHVDLARTSVGDDGIECVARVCTRLQSLAVSSYRHPLTDRCIAAVAEQPCRWSLRFMQLAADAPKHVRVSPAAVASLYVACPVLHTVVLDLP